MRRVDSRRNRFLLAKERPLIDNLVEKVPDVVDRVFELGVFKGGSVALYWELFHPCRLVAVDLNPTPVRALDRFIARRHLSGVVKPYYGVDQEDQHRLREILNENFSPRSLDLVIDDCSHLYQPTKSSLNVLLPWVRPGGIFVIEDWGWAHWAGEPWQSGLGPFGDAPALSNLIFELVMLAASCPDVVTEVQVCPSEVVLTRGDRVLDDTAFDVSNSYFTRGKKFSSSM